MRYFRLIIASCLIILLFTNFSVASDYLHDSYCEYNDSFGNFTVAFKKEVKLGRSAPSTQNGIRFVFSEKSSLRIYPSTSAYDAKYADVGELSPDVEFINKYQKKDCTIEDTKQYKGKKIICPTYQYSMIPVSWNGNESIDYYLYILYEFTDKKHHAEYQNIVDSLIIFTGEQGKIFYDSISNIHYIINEEDPYAQPLYICGKQRVRKKMLSKPCAK